MTLFNPRLIFRIINIILLIETGAFLLCIPVTLIYDENPAPFIWPAIVTFIFSTMSSMFSGKSETLKFNNRDGYLVVTLGWILFSLLGSLPYIISGEIPSFINAFFESTSGFSTTGSSILTDVEVLSYSLLFWRSLTHWIGGIGIIVLVIIILPSLHVTGYQLFTLESSLKEKIHPKTRAIGYRILFIYLGLTLAEIFLLSLGDMNLFDSICHSFGTVATGGFSTKNSSLMNYSAYSQYVVMIFMLMAGISQVVYYYLIKLNFRKIRHNEELWFYLAVIIITGAVATSLILINSTATAEEAFREGYFQVISVITCTGFATADYLFWPGAAVMLIFLLMFSGGSTGSTSGGIKIARHIIVLKSIRNTFVKLTHPNAISTVRFNGNIVSEKTAVSVISFTVLYLFVFILGSIILTFTGLDVISASSSAATCMAGIGPGHGIVGPMSNFAGIPDISKFILCILMILGRLEIITVLIIFTRSFWKL
jgi:trk system potassium uptake protein TrkH